MAKNVVVNFIGDTSSLNRAFTQSEAAGSKWSSAMKGVALGAVAVGAAMGAMAVKIGKDSIDAFREGAKAAAQTEAVLKSTGGAAKVTGSDIDKLTSSMMRKLLIDDDVIRSGANMLLTFTNIRNEAGAGNKVFDQAVGVITDMSVALGTDLNSSAIQVGKALNDPIAGISALTRVGVTFSDEQKRQIRVMTEAGDVMGAQKLILAELTKEFGGSAAAAAGAIDVFEQLAFGINEHVKPAIGEVLIKDLLPGLAKGLFGTNMEGLNVADTMAKVGDAIRKAGPDIANFAREVGEAARKLLEFFNQLRKIADFDPDDWFLKAIGLRPDFSKSAGALTAGGPILGRRARGGPVSPGSPYLVGEQGPELFVPGAAGAVIPNGRGGTPVIINVAVTGSLLGSLADVTEAVRRGLVGTGRLNVSALGGF